MGIFEKRTVLKVYAATSDTSMRYARCSRLRFGITIEPWETAAKRYETPTTNPTEDVSPKPK